MSKSNINLVNIVTSPDFSKELDRAARMSLSSNKESGFCVYTNESLSKIHVNHPVLGKVKEIKSLGMIKHYLSTELTPDDKEKGYGSHIPMNHYTMLGLHFHVSKRSPCPSGKDISALLKIRKLNESLMEQSGIKRLVRFGNGKNPYAELKGYEIDYVNPICAVGTANSIGDFNLIFYQGKTKEPINTSKFFEYAARYWNKMQSKPEDKCDGGFLEAFGFFNRFKSTKQVLNFLNSLKYLQAVALRVKNGKPAEKDLDNLKDFNLIQTRFYRT